MTVTRPFIKIKKVFKDSLDHHQELSKYIFEKSDNISLWIIGLAIGAVSIVANNIANVQSAISPVYLKPILWLLSISITTGILYRICYLYFFVTVVNVNKAMQIAFSEDEDRAMDTESSLKGGESFEQLLSIVKSGFEEDLYYLQDAYNKIDSNAQAELYKSVVNHYLQLVEYAKNEESVALDFIADTYHKFIGISKERFLKNLRNHKSGRQYRSAVRITSALYMIYILAFISALFLFVIAV